MKFDYFIVTMAFITCLGLSACTQRVEKDAIEIAVDVIDIIEQEIID